ncbi:hypothetical protein [Neptunomonas sp. XY-337]|uniref:hypothetical protein n=1 Tax=Neptunomonas sp. XY-337 TaxID=2561897 RepID=UPI0010A9DFBE|nr:hypothetical protein [Neptunomonas sp. XY-337]
MKLTLSILFVALALAGCQSTPTQPETAAPQTAPTDEQQTATPPSKASQNQNIDYLSGQLTTMQEQLIQTRADMGRLTQSQQLLLAKTQMLIDAQNTAPAAANGADNSVSVPAMESLSARIEHLSDKLNADFDLVSVYSARGTWILVRYNRRTGEAWLADDGRWNQLAEEGELPVSFYAVNLLPAANDVKGYVAARVDQRTGQTWILVEDRWASF